MSQKQCARCKEWKEASSANFVADKRNSDGFYSWCKECKNAAHREWFSKQTFTEYDKDSEKVCSGCNVSKKLSEFVPVKDSKDGLTSLCRECRNSQARENYKIPEVKTRRQKQKRLLSKKLTYGLEPDEYLRLLDSFYSCPICLRSSNSFKAVIDHDHATGKIRGLLCAKCNTALGSTYDNVKILFSMLEYLSSEGVLFGRDLSSSKLFLKTEEFRPLFKICLLCKKEKSFSEFKMHNAKNSDLYDICRSCLSKELLKYSADTIIDKKYTSQRFTAVCRRYGLNKVEYLTLVEENPHCNICNRSFISESLNIDHDHKTGKIRGVLCSSCNTALGKFQDSPQVISRAIDYLNKHKNIVISNPEVNKNEPIF